jgi:ABC-2 type transport system ATP-binding protein
VSADLAFALRGVGAAVSGNFALRDVNFELPTGYVMGLIGANGAGKTTVIRCLLGMRPIDTGEIELLGHRVPGPVALRQDVGVVLDHTYLVGDWRLAEVERTLRPFYDRCDGVRYRQLLDDFGLDLQARVKDLSRGMAMKLMIAVALSHQARLLVLDEPTSGLDPVARDELLGIVGDFLLDEGHSVLFSTHITADLDRIGDFVTVIHAGRMVQTGTKDELLDAFRVVRGGPDDLSDLVGIQLIGARRTSTGAQALVRTEEADFLDRDVLIEAPTLEEIAVHIGAAVPRRSPVSTRRTHDCHRPHDRAGPAHGRAVPKPMPRAVRPGSPHRRQESRGACAGACSARRDADRRLPVHGRRQGGPGDPLRRPAPPRRAVLYGHYAWAMAGFLATATVGTTLALLLARAEGIPFSGRTLVTELTVSWALFAINVGIQFPLFSRFGYTRTSALGTTVPLALVMLAIVRLHLTIASIQIWLPLLAAAGRAAIAMSTALATTADRRRRRFAPRPAGRVQYPI